MAELTEFGFKGTTENEYFDKEISQYKQIDSNWNLDPSTPDGAKAAIDAELYGKLDEVIRLSYNSKDPSKARGVDLNNICLLTGTERSQGTPSKVPVTLFGISGTVIPAGRQIGSFSDEITWSLDKDAKIEANGTVKASVTCDTIGSIQADPNTLTRIVTTTGGWQSVTNPSVPVIGTDRQSDPSLRIEQKLSVSRPGNAQIDNMIAEVFAVPDVIRVRMYENDTNLTDTNGLPPNSEAVIAAGGRDINIAKAIFRKKNPGCKLFAIGNAVIVKDVYDKYPSNKRDITFGRPKYIDIQVSVNVKSDGTLPSDVIPQIKKAILQYAQGALMEPDSGFNVLGFDIGEDVPAGRLYTPVNSVIGGHGASYVTDITLTGGSHLIAIAFDELSNWAENNITVTIT